MAVLTTKVRKSLPTSAFAGFTKYYSTNFLREYKPPAGIERASAILHLKSSMRARIKDDPMPVRSAHSATHRLSPLNSIILLARVFLACCFAVAQRQLSGLYGPFWFGNRSRECFGEGLKPMSAIKFSKSTHLGSTRIPRPPYKYQYSSFGFVHRCQIAFHVRHSAVFEAPWNSFPDWHPQLFDSPLRKFLAFTGLVTPQIQRQTQ